MHLPAESRHHRCTSYSIFAGLQNEPHECLGDSLLMHRNPRGAAKLRRSMAQSARNWGNAKDDVLMLQARAELNPASRCSKGHIRHDFTPLRLARVVARFPRGICFRCGFQLVPECQCEHHKNHSGHNRGEHPEVLPLVHGGGQQVFVECFRQAA